ncbi:GNAT family N-acetyltransferase [Streptococcus halichoeri]|uniref:GNAT family N-acetyltransferase n=1 Tax=Streptococcus halichoeri TaxID=254785 RepID=UPI000DB2EF10|nr:GNAT family N-acetyltransferase [Streptococcus halichoeri]PZO94057.1 MAG: GNAT family N-acetyltransferase [Streptococcus pyogenes]
MLIRQATIADWETIVQIEQTNFSPAEATSPEVIRERLERLPETFLVAIIKDQLAGYIEGPIVAEPRLTDDLFHQTPLNPATQGYVAVTSLSIAPDFQQQGVGMALLAAMKDLAVAKKCQGIILTCHDYLIPYYEMNGFVNQGLSDSVHGGAIWYDMLWQPATL